MTEISEGTNKKNNGINKNNNIENDFVFYLEDSKI